MGGLNLTHLVQIYVLLLLNKLSCICQVRKNWRNSFVLFWVELDQIEGQPVLGWRIKSGPQPICLRHPL